MAGEDEAATDAGDDLDVVTSGDDDLAIVTDEDKSGGGEAAKAALQTIGAALSPADLLDGDGPLDAVYDISVDVTAVLGTATMRVSQLLKMGRGDVVVVNENLGVNLTKIIKTNIAKM
jgi:flagellar motor switch protein FliN/FliY